ncbi:hypothetical protein DPMN_056123 [Dreissena polymorpha]|uniref:Uncharacterized protein n=1 Tax=Dreissena polymorpha TaxID=45954 RepID=A0A9D4CRZ0_DREPO|nr:hypothetical protein DPMN_056123 [Dreissena polymorpha]
MKNSLPNRGIGEGLLIGNTVFNAENVNNGDSIPIRIINTSPESVTIKEGSTLGYAEDLQESDLENSQVESDNLSHGLNQPCSDRSDIEKVLSKICTNVQAQNFLIIKGFYL